MRDSIERFRNVVDSEGAVGRRRRRKRDGKLRGAADGFVFGILTPQGKIDDARCLELIHAAGEGMPCTFHRAFDEVVDQKEALEAVITVGFKAVLTAGGKGSAEEGAERLRELREWARGRIEVIVGGGLRSGNARRLKESLGMRAEWWHSAAIVDGGEEASEEEVRGIVKALKGEEVMRGNI